MELISVINNIYAVPVAIVILCAIVVFAVGFKAESEPNLRHLTLLKSKPSDDKKKKKKKEVKVVKPQTNGAVKQKESPKKEKSSTVVVKKSTPIVPFVVRDPEPVAVLKAEKKVQKQEKVKDEAVEADNNAGEWEVVTPKARKSKKDEETEEIQSQAPAVVPVEKKIKEDSWAEEVEKSPLVPSAVVPEQQEVVAAAVVRPSLPVPPVHEPQPTSEEEEEEDDDCIGSQEFTWADVMKHKKGKKRRNVITTPVYEENSQMYGVDVEAFPSIEVHHDPPSEDKTSEISEKISELSSDIEIIHHDEVMATFPDHEPDDTITQQHDEEGHLSEEVEVLAEED